MSLKPLPFLADFERLAGLPLPPRRLHAADSPLVRDESQFATIAKLCFDRPQAGALLERRLPLWLRLAPREEGAWALAGYVHYSLRRYARAERAFCAAIRLCPDNVDNWWDLGLALRHLGASFASDLLFDTAHYIEFYKRRGCPPVGRGLLRLLGRQIRRAGLDYGSCFQNHLPR